MLVFQSANPASTICRRVSASQRCSPTRMMNCTSYRCSPSLDHIRSVSAVEQKRDSPTLEPARLASVLQH